MKAAGKMVFLLTIDNTLLDSDRIVADLGDHFAHEFGEESRDRYWEIFEALHIALDYADYLGGLQRYRVGGMNDPRLLLMPAFLMDYPFAESLYPAALDVIAYLPRWGPTVILSDGDGVFQLCKAQRLGFVGRGRSRVLIYLHKEQMLDDALPGSSLRHGGRQAAHSGGNEKDLGRSFDDRIPSPGMLRARPSKYRRLFIL
jgi:hypothetical protein